MLKSCDTNQFEYVTMMLREFILPRLAYKKKYFGFNL